MAHNFKLVGTLYSSKAGDDSNDGLSPDRPKKTPAGKSPGVSFPSTEWSIIGSGYYILSGLTLYDIQGDGEVILKASTPSATINLAGSAVNSGDIQGAKNLTIDGFTFASNVAGFFAAQRYEDLRLKNCNGSSVNWTIAGSRGVNFFKSIFINTTLLGSALYSLNYSIVINTEIQSRELLNSFVGFNSVVKAEAINPTLFRNNNIQGIVRLPIAGGFFADYAIQDQFTGTPQDNGYGVGVKWLTEANLTADGYTGTVAGWNTAVATCINRDPKFNDAAAEDFTLQADSPHFRRAQNGIDNIGGTLIALSVDNNLSEDILTQIDEIGGGYFVDTGETEGYIDYVFGTGNLQNLGKITPRLDLKFDSDFNGGSGENNNVPDSEPTTIEYAKLTQTNGTSTTTVINVNSGHSIVAGNYVRVRGQVREVTSVATNAITINPALASAPPTATDVTYGTFEQIALLNPNRLTYQLRTTTANISKPLATASGIWDNGIDPVFGRLDELFTFEWYDKPQYIYVSGSVYSNAEFGVPTGGTFVDVPYTWAHLRVYLRNNYSSKGLV